MKSTNFERLERRLRRLTGKAIDDFGMIAADDVVLVCLSGGKDSYTMLEVLRHLQRCAPVRFDLIAMNLDQKQPGFPADVLPDYLRPTGLPYHIVTEDTYSIVTDKIPAGKTMCSLCSRLRRGIIYRLASEVGATKIALGHHRDDMVETFFLNMMFGGRLKAMSPKLKSDDSRHIVIRPLVYCAERDIACYSRQMNFPIIPCSLCGSQDNLQRQNIKRMLAEWERSSPGRVETIFQALGRITPSHLLDRSLFGFDQLKQDHDARGISPVERDQTPTSLLR